MSKSKLSVLAAALSEKSGLSVEDAEKFIKQMFDVANDALQQDKIVKMKWLGTFKVQSVKDRESIDVNTGERILIEGRDKISFTPDSVLKEIVNKPFAQFETVVVNDGVDFSAIDEKFAKMEAEEKATDGSSAQEVGETVNEAEALSASKVNDETAVNDEAALIEGSSGDVETSGDKVASADEESTSEINAPSGVYVFGEDEVKPQTPAITDEVVVISDQNGVITISSDSPSLPEGKEATADVIVVGETASNNEVDKIEDSHEEENVSEEVSDNKAGNVLENSEAKFGEIAEQAEQVELNESAKPLSTAKSDASDDSGKIEETENSEKVGEDAEKLENEKVEQTASNGFAKTSESEVVDGSEENVESDGSEEMVESDSSEEDSEDQTSRHFVVPKYMVAIAALVLVALVGGGCWFAFNYGKMSVQNAPFALQADKPQIKPDKKATVPKAAANQDSAQIILQQKAKQDSIRLAEANKAVKMAEEAAQKSKEKAMAEEQAKAETKAAKVQADETKVLADKAQTSKALADKLKADKAKEAKLAKEAKAANDAAAKPSKYDSDPRVRTGAYRIVGTAQTVTVKPGQTLAGISKTYLGAGMECYVEAINGSSEVKAGQKLKIPKLELKKKSQASK